MGSWARLLVLSACFSAAFGDPFEIYVNIFGGVTKTMEVDGPDMKVKDFRAKVLKDVILPKAKHNFKPSNLHLISVSEAGKGFMQDKASLMGKDNLLSTYGVEKESRVVVKLDVNVAAKKEDATKKARQYQEDNAYEYESFGNYDFEEDRDLEWERLELALERARLGRLVGNRGRNQFQRKRYRGRS